MKLKHYLYIGVALGILAACSDEGTDSPTYTVGKADNEIQLRAGIDEGSADVQTRATAAEYKQFSKITQLHLRVDGTWTGHVPETVSKTTTGKTSQSTIVVHSGNVYEKHTVDLSTKLYWDDYGTADPANKETGRAQGLTIYGVAVDGKDALPTTPTDLNSNSLSWTDLSWNIGTMTPVSHGGQTLNTVDQSNGWANYDLVTSNNIKAGNDGTYTFENSKANPVINNLLKFTHAMSKITVNVTAVAGFPGSATGPENAMFERAPEVTLLGFYHLGTVNVEAKTSTPTTSYTAQIKTWRDQGAAWTTGGKHTSQFTALVFPGNTFADATEILQLKADGNVFFVSAAKINAAMEAAGDTDHEFKQGKNYIFNISVNKTEIIVTATLKDWEDVTAEQEIPVINVNASFPDASNGRNDSFTSFSFYRSLKTFNKYSDDYSGNENRFYAAEATPTGALNGTGWDFSTNKLYWPSHDTHYFFRGVWPVTSVLTTDVDDKPHVKDNGDYQVIDINNVAYTKSSYPSDLAIGMPVFTETNKNCDSHANHTAVDQSVYGICATTGTIALNFKYVMSQVEVELQSVGGVAAAVNVGANTVVELVNVYNKGEVKLGDRGINTTGSAGNYTLNTVSGSGKELFRHSAIVPQTLTYTTPGAQTNLRFKVTVTNNDAVLYADAAEYNAAKGTSLDDAAFAALTTEQKTKTPATTDVYYADVNPIKKTDSPEKVAPNGKWESGVHYKYVLTLSKTDMKVTATLTDWVTVNASENVWF